MYYYQSVKEDGEVIAKINVLAERYPPEILITIMVKLGMKT